MKRRKKKNTGQQQKQEFRHQKNLFYRRIKKSMALLGDASTFNHLDEADLFLLHYCRIRPYKIINVENAQNKIGEKELRFINKYLSDVLHNTFVELNGHKISIYDFSIDVETLFLIWRNSRKENRNKFRAHFPVFATDEFQKLREEVLGKVEKNLELMAWLYSDLTHQTIRFIKQEVKNSNSVTDQSAYFNNYHIEAQAIDTDTLTLDGNTRTIFRLCLNLKQVFVPGVLPAKQLGIDGLMQNFRLKVYIQQHAIDRMNERLGSRFAFLAYVHVMVVLLVKPIELEKGKSFLFPVQHGKITVGYLKADLFGDKLIIRTFLFLTNNGTPEGKRLNELVGLQKADKKYLGIDKLSTFINSDLGRDKELKELFCKAGCGGLFQLDKSLLDEPGSKEVACAGFLKQYLNM
jgi:hypothetical protein